jgi:hypothetical protein
LLLGLHPAWTISAYQGDCGIFKQTASILFTLLFVVLLTWQFSLPFVCKPIGPFDPADDTVTAFPDSAIANPYDSPRAISQPPRTRDGVIRPLLAFLILMAFCLILWLWRMLG